MRKALSLAAGTRGTCTADEFAATIAARAPGGGGTAVGAAAAALHACFAGDACAVHLPAMDEALLELKDGRAHARLLWAALAKHALAADAKDPLTGAGAASSVAAPGRAALLVELFAWRGEGGGGGGGGGTGHAAADDDEWVHVGEVERFIREASTKLEHIADVGAEMIARMDRDGDGVIDFADLQADAARNPALYTILLGCEEPI